MLLPEEALSYELAVTFGGVLMMMILQVITGPIFTWMIWALAFAVVTLSYVDHVCIGWTKLLPATQIVRVLWNSLLCVGAGGGLYGTIILLVPDVNMQSLTSILNAIQYAIRMHHSWGPLIYFAIYSQFYLCTLSFFRFIINTVLIVWSVIHRTEWIRPASDHGGHHQPTTTAQPTPMPASSSSPKAAAAGGEVKPHVE